MTIRRRLVCLILMTWGLSWGLGPLGAANAGDGGTITGQVVFSGTPPTPSSVSFGGEQQCALIHGDHPPQVEDVVVNSNGTLRDVLVYVVGEVQGTYTPPAEPLVFEQKGCLFVPHVGAVMIGQPVEVRNDDPVLHNVRAQSKQGQSFNIAQPVQGMKTTKKLLKPEIGIPIKCDVHFWMTGYLHVLPHPFFAITETNGTFAIKGLPPGTYTLEAWHGKLGTKQLTVTVTGNESHTAEFTFGSP